MTITHAPDAPLVAVVGATGMQGGSVVRALADSDKAYRVRAFTRDASKPAAQALSRANAEVYPVSLVVANQAEVYKAFEGADYAFLVTNFWEHVDGKKETAEGKLLIDAAKAAGVRGIVWSGLCSVRDSSSGKYTQVWHFDAKAVVSAYGRQSGVPFVDVQAGFYGVNFLNDHGLVAKQADGTLALAWPQRPTTTWPFIDTAHDYGMFVVKYALERATFPDGEEILVHGENISVADIAAQLSQVTGKTIVYKQVSLQEWKSYLESLGHPPHIVMDMVEGMAWVDEFGWKGTVPVDSVPRRPRTFIEFAKNTDWSALSSK